MYNPEVIAKVNIIKGSDGSESVRGRNREIKFNK